jgi:hypothetical protein
MNGTQASVPAAADGHLPVDGICRPRSELEWRPAWKPNLQSRSSKPRISLRFSLPRSFHHFQEALSGIFDIGIAVLMGAALHRQQCATMDVFEIAERKFESRLAILNMLRVDPEMPL